MNILTPELIRSISFDAHTASPAEAKELANLYLRAKHLLSQLAYHDRAANIREKLDGCFELQAAEDFLEDNPTRDSVVEAKATQTQDWYERRHELVSGQVFRSYDGIVKLDRTVPGDGTKWYVAHWSNGWSYENGTIEPGDLTERLADDYAG